MSRLFEIVKPDIAFFGLKDFQQLAVVKELVKQLNNKVRIVPGKIIRETDGLAMSSRNRLLEPEIRKYAPVIFETLSAASEMIRKATSRRSNDSLKRVSTVQRDSSPNISRLLMILNLFL